MPKDFEPTRVDLDDVLGCTGIVVPVTPEQKAIDRKPLQVRPKKPLKLPTHICRYRDETEDKAKTRQAQEYTNYANNRQLACSRIDSFVHIDEKDGEPYLYIIFPQIKAKLFKARPLAAALFGAKHPQGTDHLGLDCKVSDKLLLANICNGRKHIDSWFNTKKQLVIRFPVGIHQYSQIPLYEDPADVQ